jgi:hypothetical protein
LQVAGKSSLTTKQDSYLHDRPYFLVRLYWTISNVAHNTTLTPGHIMYQKLFGEEDNV